MRCVHIKMCPVVFFIKEAVEDTSKLLLLWFSQFQPGKPKSTADDVRKINVRFYSSPSFLCFYIIMRIIVPFKTLACISSDINHEVFSCTLMFIAVEQLKSYFCICLECLWDSVCVCSTSTTLLLFACLQQKPQQTHERHFYKQVRDGAILCDIVSLLKLFLQHQNFVLLLHKGARQ